MSGESQLADGEGLWLGTYLDDLDQRAGSGRILVAERGCPEGAAVVNLHRDYAGQAEVLVGLAVFDH